MTNNFSHIQWLKSKKITSFWIVIAAQIVLVGRQFQGYFVWLLQAQFSWANSFMRLIRRESDWVTRALEKSGKNFQTSSKNEWPPLLIQGKSFAFWFLSGNDWDLWVGHGKELFCPCAFSRVIRNLTNHKFQEEIVALRWLFAIRMD